MRVNYINSWKKGNKKVYKGNIAIRFGRITIFELEWDIKNGYLRFIILNFGVEIM